MTVARKAAGSAAIAFSFFASVPASAQTQIVSGLPSVCRDMPTLEEAFQRHTRTVSYARQLSKNYGFQRNETELENAANLPAAQIWEGKQGIRKLLFDETLRNTREELERQLQSGALDASLTAASVAEEAANRAVRARLTPEAVELLQSIKGWDRIPSRSGAAIGQVVALHNRKEALEILDRAKTIYGISDDATQGKLLEATASLAHEVAVMGINHIGSVSPKLLPATQAGWVGLMLSVDEWALMQAYKSADAVRAVRKLTESNVMQLELLKKTAGEMRIAIDSLRIIRPQLSQLAKTCDRTRLVKKGGSSAGKWITGIVVLGGVGAAGAYYYAEEQKKLNGGGGSSGGYCLSTRNCIVGISSCSCSPVGERCGYSSPGSSAGGSCPCKSGLSCNNGVCEGRTGRCPF